MNTPQFYGHTPLDLGEMHMPGHLIVIEGTDGVGPLHADSPAQGVAGDAGLRGDGYRISPLGPDGRRHRPGHAGPHA